MATYESYAVGDHEFSNISLPVQVKFVDYAYTDLVETGDALTIPIPAGWFVTNVAHVVTTAFSGGSPLMNIGDGSDADYWIDELDQTLSTLGDASQSVGGSNAGAMGYMFLSAGVIKIDHAASLAAGAGRVYIFFIDTNSNWRNASYL